MVPQVPSTSDPAHAPDTNYSEEALRALCAPVRAI
jgi:hypothetical protein